MTNRNLKMSDVCTDKKQRCTDSRVGPEKPRWVTVYLQIRASRHQCSTSCTLIDEIELNRTLINENQRLRQTMNQNRCAAVQCTSRVSSRSSCGLHACTCLACGTLNGWFLVVYLGITFWMVKNLSTRDASNT